MSHFSVWAISDPHLSFGVPHKKMDLFGPLWNNHSDTIKASWDAVVSPDDIVLIPGDISWAMHLSDALPDLNWLDERPGTKILIKGNHDYWWGSLSKVRAALPKSIRVIQHDAVNINGIAIGGARLWDTTEFTFNSIIDIRPIAATPKVQEEGKDKEIFRRELNRLEASLQHLPKDAPLKIVMTHYPPIGTNLLPSSASSLFERYGVSLAVFGHLHSIRQGLPPLFGTARGIRYALCSCDYLNFSPLCVVRNGMVVPC
jgi:predicted phosphohydrolase